ncbi:hypothetical protein CDAR_242451 [Caerostris darwini]|uniref:Uncharacterized protein n=1 Tax=Caerostris darwini TaxID=1538125 RepID=A0AAV4T349_9ARAC|nr:hypothetical protein CDAR_242451 [Caerostris darwini]
MTPSLLPLEKSLPLLYQQMEKKFVTKSTETVGSKTGAFDISRLLPSTIELLLSTRLLSRHFHHTHSFNFHSYYVIPPNNTLLMFCAATLFPHSSIRNLFSFHLSLRLFHVEHCGRGQTVQNSQALKIANAL